MLCSLGTTSVVHSCTTTPVGMPNVSSHSKRLLHAWGKIFDFMFYKKLLLPTVNDTADGVGKKILRRRMLVISHEDATDDVQLIDENDDEDFYFYFYL